MKDLNTDAYEWQHEPSHCDTIDKTLHTNNSSHKISASGVAQNILNIQLLPQHNGLQTEWKQIADKQTMEVN